jgi:uncharacterized RDD family membrane protein YckC
MSSEQKNSGELAGMGIRFLALTLDWVAASLIMSGVTRQSYGYELQRLGLFFTEVFLLTALMGASAGQRICGLRVIDATTGGAVPPMRAFIRTGLILLVLPALFKKDGVAYHDSICNTKVVRR